MRCKDKDSNTPVTEARETDSKFSMPLLIALETRLKPNNILASYFL